MKQERLPTTAATGAYIWGHNFHLQQSMVLGIGLKYLPWIGKSTKIWFLLGSDLHIRV